MSGEVYAAAKASTCCDAAGEESPNGAPRKIAAGNFVGSPGWRGSQHITRETNSLFGAHLNTTLTYSEWIPSQGGVGE